MARTTLRTKNSVILVFISRLRQDSELLLDIKVDVDDFFSNTEGPRIVLSNKTPNLDCWEFDGGRKVEKYPFFRFRGSDRYIKVVSVLKCLEWFEQPTRPIASPPLSFREFSHLCGHKFCVNPKHIIVEKQSCNQKRRRCHRMGRCRCDNTIKCVFRNEGMLR